MTMVDYRRRQALKQEERAGQPSPSGSFAMIGTVPSIDSTGYSSSSSTSTPSVATNSTFGGHHKTQIRGPSPSWIKLPSFNWHSRNDLPANGVVHFLTDRKSIARSRAKEMCDRYELSEALNDGLLKLAPLHDKSKTSHNHSTGSPSLVGSTMTLKQAQQTLESRQQQSPATNVLQSKRKDIPRLENDTLLRAQGQVEISLHGQPSHMRWISPRLTTTHSDSRIQMQINDRMVTPNPSTIIKPKDVGHGPAPWTGDTLTNRLHAPRSDPVSHPANCTEGTQPPAVASENNPNNAPFPMVHQLPQVITCVKPSKVGPSFIQTSIADGDLITGWETPRNTAATTTTSDSTNAFESLSPASCDTFGSATTSGSSESIDHVVLDTILSSWTVSYPGAAAKGRELPNERLHSFC